MQAGVSASELSGANLELLSALRALMFEAFSAKTTDDIDETAAAVMAGEELEREQLAVAVHGARADAIDDQIGTTELDALDGQDLVVLCYTP